jgi:hypothetical protein
VATSEVTIWEQIMRPNGEVMSRDTAERILEFSFSVKEKERMKQLLARAKDGTISPAEELEISEFERVGNLLSILKAKARRIVKPRIR